ncbi:MAG TPA: sensor domain-containing diguanylate cyclase [Pseudolabrys sp.]|jgi:diguanylate cyclase (GGDEF)-like protein|nr:sensor domain-containing diguanylate cyclase [Pseudolabrys sp.]
MPIAKIPAISLGGMKWLAASYAVRIWSRDTLRVNGLHSQQNDAHAAMSDTVSQGEWLRVQELHSYQVLDTVREEPFDRVVRLARSILRAPIALVSIVDADRQWLKARSGLTYSQMSRSRSFCSHTIENDEPLIVPDACADARFRALPLVVEPPYVRSYIGVPLRTPAGHRIGTLCVMDTEVRQPTLEQIGILQDLAALVMDELELRLVATTDSLTGAFSRRAFLTSAARDLARAVESGGKLSCVLLDVDHFKRINDNHGHAAGDRALQEVVTLLKAGLRAQDYIGRLGGEEFAVIMPGADGAAAIEVGERLREQVMNAWLITPKGEVRLTISAGIATLTAADTRIDDLLCRADEALYAAKTAGRNRLMRDDGRRRVAGLCLDPVKSVT